jgi:TonB family protein
MDAQGVLNRKVKSRVPPVYPVLARQANISGVVRVEVTVAPDGNVKDPKVLGGHPLLVGAALDALKKWRFEPAAQETTGTIEFKFAPE